MTHTLKLTALVFATSFAGLLHAGDYQHDSGRAAYDSYRSPGTQTAGLFDLFRGYGASARYGNSHTAGYGNYGRSSYGNSGYRNAGYANAGYRNGGYNTGYRPTSNQYRPTGYAPGYGAGYANSGYRGNSGAGYGGSGYGGSGAGCSLSGHGGDGGYYGR